jgi:hypothetical protein
MEKVNASRARNEREFNFVESHRKALKTTIEGLGRIHSMDCIVKICANICCVTTVLFDIRAGNPIPLIYSICIKTIEVVKHHDFFNRNMTIWVRAGTKNSRPVGFLL